MELQWALEKLFSPLVIHMYDIWQQLVRKSITGGDISTVYSKVSI